MRNFLVILVLFTLVLSAGKAFAPLITTTSTTPSSSTNDDTSVVDLSDKDTSKPVKLLR